MKQHYLKMVIGVWAVVSMSCTKTESSSTIKGGSTALPADYCYAWVVGNDPVTGQNQLGRYSEKCAANANPAILFSVSHENKNNNHNGDVNYRDNIVSYMADYNQSDVGQWLKFAAGSHTEGGKNFQLAVDAINYNTTTPTGRKIHDGYLYFGINDLASYEASLGERDLWVRFKYKITVAELGAKKAATDVTPGHRVILGFSMRWKEPNRANDVHFFEINLFRNNDFHKDHIAEPACPQQRPYDRCWYDPKGKYSDGYYLPAPYVLSNGKSVSDKDSEWHDFDLNVSKYVSQLDWKHPPASWNDISITPYLGLESKSASRLFVEVENYRAQYLAKNKDNNVPPPKAAVKEAPNPSAAVTTTVTGPIAVFDTEPRVNPTAPDYIQISTVIPPKDKLYPKGLFRDQNSTSALYGYDSNYCSISSSEHLSLCGYTQQQYDDAPKYSLSQVGLTDKGSCICTQGNNPLYPRGLFRDQGSSAALFGYELNYCLITSGEHLRACGYSQQQYDNAPKYSLTQIKSTNKGACVCP